MAEDNPVGQEELESTTNRDGELMKINLPPSPPTPTPAADLAEEIQNWAVEVSGSKAKAEEILGQADYLDAQGQAGCDVAEKLLDTPEGTATLLDPIADGADVGSLHVMQFDGEETLDPSKDAA